MAWCYPLMLPSGFPSRNNRCASSLENKSWWTVTLWCFRPLHYCYQRFAILKCLCVYVSCINVSALLCVFLQLKVYGHDDPNICASPQVACAEHMLHVHVSPNEILQKYKKKKKKEKKSNWCLCLCLCKHLRAGSESECSLRRWHAQHDAGGEQTQVAVLPHNMLDGVERQMPWAAPFLRCFLVTVKLENSKEGTHFCTLACQCTAGWDVSSGPHFLYQSSHQYKLIHC